MKIFDITFFVKDGRLMIKDESCGCCGSVGPLTKQRLDELVAQMNDAVGYLNDQRSKAFD